MMFFTVLMERPAFSSSISCSRIWPVVRSRTFDLSPPRLVVQLEIDKGLAVPVDISIMLDRVTSPSSCARSTCATK